MKFYIFAKCFYLAMIIAWACGFILGSGLILNGLYAFIFSVGHPLNTEILEAGIILLITALVIIVVGYISYLDACFELDIREDFGNFL